MNVGIAVDTPDGQCTAHAVLLQCSADLQARGPMTNMKSFNGKWGCLYCTNPGETTESDQLHRFWPYKSSAVLRSPQSFIDDGRAALQDGDAVSSQVFIDKAQAYRSIVTCPLPLWDIQALGIV